MNKILFLLICLIISDKTFSQMDTAKYSDPHPGFWKSRTMNMLYAPLGLFAGSALLWGERGEVRDMRNRYIPTFRHHYDDYLQYAPLAAVIGLNAAGIKGKHKPGRALVSYLFSAGIMAVTVNTIKYTAKVERPDGSSNNSFPSGHTANSFLNASILHKEYGQYRHPLYSVAGYTAATATGIGRELNNRHWVSDVLAGAGIGILSAELGYLITEKIYKDKGNNPPLKYNPYPIDKKPSFLEIRTGVAFLLDKDATFNTNELTTKTGFNMGLEGAWFFTKNFGVGGEFAFSSFPINSDKLLVEDPSVNEISDGFYTQPMGIRYLTVGPFFSLPLARNWFITGKINAGASAGAIGTLNMELKEEYEDVFGTTTLPVLTYQPESAFAWSVGAGIQKRIGRNTALKLFSTYFDSRNKFRLEGLSAIDPETGKYTYETIAEDKVNFEHFSFGLALTAFIW